MPAPRLICLIGAECAGKTTLATALAQHFNGLVVPEALRNFCDQQGRTPQQSEQEALLQVQVAQEDQAVAQARRLGLRYVFCDTAPLLTAVYSDHYFGDKSLYPCALALHSRYALTLFLEPDLPWVADGLQRDGGLAQQCVHALLAQKLPGMEATVRIGGVESVRAQVAIAAVQGVCVVTR